MGQRRRPPRARGRPAPRRPRRRRSSAIPLVIVLLAAGAVAYVLTADADVWSALASTGDAEPQPAAAADVDLDDLADAADADADGSVTVTLGEAEVAGLVQEGLARDGGTTLRDVAVDLQPPSSSAGRLELEGTLDDQPLPVVASVDLDVVDGQVVPRVVDARVGPISVPADTREQLNARLRGVGLLAERGITVERLHTTEDELVVTGRQA